MEAEVTNKVHKTIVKKTKKAAIIGFVVILLLGAAFGFYYYKTHSSAKVTVKQQTAVVRRGDLSAVVTGSGPMASANRKDISPVLVGDTKLTKVNFKQGDKVKAGDLLFELDDSDAVDNVQSAESAITQAQLSQSSTVSDLGKLTVTAPFSGYASNITVKDGENINQGQTILTLIDKSKFKVTLQFVSTANIKVGDSAQVNMSASGTYQIFKGIVTYVSDKTNLSTDYAADKTKVTADGYPVRSIDIVVDNPGYSLEGLTAGANINGMDNDINGKFVYNTEQDIKSDVSGTIKKVYVNSDQYIKAGTKILDLESDTLVTTKEKGDLSLQDLQTKLDNAKQKLLNYKIYAPIDGTIVKQTVKVGDTVQSGQVLTSIADNGHMQFAIPVDELDIAKVQNGQKVTVTVDALSDTTTKPLTGVVTDIALEGTSSNGVSTYPVTITMDNPDRLKSGMNANASIIVNSKTNALFVPLQAVQKIGGKSFVWLKGATTNFGGMRNGNNSSGSASRVRPSGSGQNGASGNGQGGGQNGGTGNGQGNRQAGGNSSGTTAGNQSGTAARGNSANQAYYAGAGMVPVEVGMSTDSSIEIVSGLKEGDVVVLPPVSASTTTPATTQQQRGPGGGGAMFMGGGRG